MAIVYENLTNLVNLGLIVIIVLAIIYFVKGTKRAQEWERRIIIIILFFSVHELAFFLEDMLVSRLTEILFAISLLYALIYILSFERKLKDMEDERRDFLKNLEEIRSIQEIREKLKK
jgi:Ca2+/Na+ antiporter